MKIVIDASIGVKWFSCKDEDNIDLALQIRGLKLKNEIEITVPDLFFFETMNALLKKKGFTTEIMHFSLETLYRMDLNIIYPGKEIIDSAIDIARRSKLTFYDSLYIAAAMSRQALLITEDQAMLQSRSSFSFIKSPGRFFLSGK